MSLIQVIAPHLPFLRRYARALLGDQALGDGYVRAALEGLAADSGAWPAELPPRIGLYRAFQNVLQAAGLPEPSGAPRRDGTAPAERLLRLAPLSRQAFLLTALEGFSNADAARVLSVEPSRIEQLIARAQREIDAELATDVLIIEDEAVIAADIEALVLDLGHRVPGVAATRSEALALAREVRPGLVLADIQLADGSSGIDAVKDILAEHDVPVIFITAFPERLLTGERPEPTFLITKPFQPETVKAAVGQALFFHPGRQGDAAG
jgi:DNA-directed RNA polymerase specialized sigma24 family protein